MKLLPSKRKRKRKKLKAGLMKKNLKKNGSEKILNISNLDIKLYNPLNANNNAIKEKPKTSEKVEKIVKKIIINCDNNNNLVTPKKEENVDPLKRDIGTQTEEIFFKMHWSFFAGDYKILQAKNNNNFNKVFNRNKSEHTFNFKDFSKKKFTGSKEKEYLFNNNNIINNNNKNKNINNNNFTNNNFFLNNNINNSNNINHKFNSLYNKFKTNVIGNNNNNNLLTNKKLNKNIPCFVKVNQNNNLKYQRSESTKKIYGSFQL
jgi:hypothetical protein